MILKSDGTVWAAGSNYWGQLGFSDSGDRQTFTQVSDDRGNPLSGIRDIAVRGDITVLLKNDGSLLLAGSYTEPDSEPSAYQAGANETETHPGFVPLVPEQGAASPFKGVRKIVLGYNSIYVIASDGRLWAAGSNRYGQLSLGLDTEVSPVLKLINP